MDIIQMYYFINIVECNYNLSLAAKKIHISQPALSQFISNFEREKELTLFNRKNGRLQSLTPAGERIYQSALEITELHEQMEEVVRLESLKQKGTIRIGLPSLILRVYFSEYFPNLSLTHPDAHIEITENGSNELRKMLIAGEIDMAILIEPTSLDPKQYEQHVIEIDEMVAFMNIEHPKANKNKLTWQELKGFPIGTFNKNFMTHELVAGKLQEANIEDQIQFTSSTWDYLIEATRNKEIITILPRPVETFINSDAFAVKHFEDFIPFNFRLCRPLKDKYSSIEEFVYEDIINHFYEPIQNS